MPIRYLRIQSPFDLGRITFKPMTRELLDLWHKPFMHACGSEAELGEKIFLEKFRCYQGHTAAVFQAETDAKLGKERAIKEASKSVAILRVFSQAALDHRMWSHCVLWGTGHLDSEVTIELDERGYPLPTSSIAGIPPRPDRFSTVHIDKLSKWLQHIHPFLLSSSKNSNFSECVINALRLYSESIIKKRIQDKLVYLFAALESIFLRGDNEPIIHSISLRIALFCRQEP